jgi:hypothetical protein
MHDLPDEHMMGAQFNDLEQFAKQMVFAFRDHRRISFHRIGFCQIELLELIRIATGTLATLVNGFQHVARGDVDHEFPRSFDKVI